MLKRRAVHKDMAEANVYAARRLKDMAQSLGGLAKTFGRCREEPGLSREDGIAALEAASAMVCGACESCGIQRECRRGGMMRIIICIIFCGPLKKRAVWNMRTCPGGFWRYAGENRIIWGS